MVRGSRRILCGLAAAIALLAAPLTAQGYTIGSNLLATPNGGVCSLSGSGEASCSFVQVGLADVHTSPGGVRASAPGVITRWSISTGLATPATASVKVRLRILEASGVSRVFGASSYEELPLNRPGVHVLPARLPIAGSRQYVVVDTAVSGRGEGEAAAPFAHRASGIGSVWKWTPALSEGLVPPASGEGDLELLVNATVERDRDRDGFGDRSQDRCPKDPTRQADCDRRPPRIKIFYAKHQNFLGTRRVVVRVRSNEAASAYASSQLDLPGETWGLDADERRVREGGVTKLVMHLPSRPRRVGERALTSGKRIRVKVFVAATDLAGNKTRFRVVRIKP
jgi:hypothetical protein